MSVSPLSQLPEAFLRRTRAWLSPPDFDAWCASVERPPLAVRWTGASEATAEGRSYLLEQGLEIEDVPWLPEAWSLGQISRETVSRLPMVADQLLFMQSLSSMACVMAVGVEAGHDVLDLCAAPGAKTSLLRRMQQGSGILVANDLSRRRMARLRSLLEGLDIQGVDVRTGPGEMMGRDFAGCFDRVLVDVPCSSEGRFSLSDPSTWANWSEGVIRGLARRQEALLESACATARRGGEVLYATCTMAPEENERVVDRVLRRGRVGMELIPIDLEIDSARPGLMEWGSESFLPEIRHTRRILGTSTTTPFFMAKLRRTS